MASLNDFSRYGGWVLRGRSLEQDSAEPHMQGDQGRSGKVVSSLPWQPHLQPSAASSFACESLPSPRGNGSVTFLRNTRNGKYCCESLEKEKNDLNGESKKNMKTTFDPLI